MDLIKVGITHGDMNGIGYEVILKTLADNRIFEKAIFIIYGYSKAAAFYRRNLCMEEGSLNIIKSHKDELPKTSTRKVKRKDLQQWYESREA